MLPECATRSWAAWPGPATFGGLRRRTRGELACLAVAARAAARGHTRRQPVLLPLQARLGLCSSRCQCCLPCPAPAALGLCCWPGRRWAAVAAQALHACAWVCQAPIDTNLQGASRPASSIPRHTGSLRTASQAAPCGLGPEHELPAGFSPGSSAVSHPDAQPSAALKEALPPPGKLHRVSPGQAAAVPLLVRTAGEATGHLPDGCRQRQQLAA